MKRAFDTITKKWVNVEQESKFQVWIVTDEGESDERLIEEVLETLPKEDNVRRILKEVDALP